MYRSRDATQIPTTDPRIQQRTNGNTIQLILDNVQKDDAGIYTVNARSPTGSTSRDVELRIGKTQNNGDEPPAFLRRLNDLSVKVGTRTRFLVEIRSSTELSVCMHSFFLIKKLIRLRRLQI